ncbi:glycosyltransferase family 4 protein [Crateriforma conspicua]|uniref:glycosyltransferase family 4 protein n=1 Tax=Crateriforma conspicua TaxID=2527996 RepID=UPI001189D0C2|nr:glycosyltransferase family 4 protein [Crateriforma conspicua]QDV65951.1 GDP-mannose-dependent alpha-(1-6)-phosphatidylinositol monomannoside mannosyltransferase [Crateriforma conspicua]
MKRYLFVESYPHVIAGQQRTLLSLLQRCRRHDIEPVVLTPGPGAYVDHLRDAGFEVHVAAYPESLGRYGGAIYRDGIRGRVSVMRQTAGYVWGLRSVLRQLDPAAVFYNDMRGLLTVGVAAKTMGVAGMIWDKLDKPHGKLDWFQLPLVRKNPIISGPVAMKYPAWQRRIWGNRICRVPNGVDYGRFQNQPDIRSDLGWSPEQCVFGIVGTITRRKGHDILRRAWQTIAADHPHARVVAIGSWQDDPVDTEFYRSLEPDSVDRFDFLGQRPDVPELMNAIDVLIIPSRHEGLGQVTLEAMACGKPVIGSRTGGIQETIVDDETGLLFETGDVDALAAAMARLAGDADLRRSMGQAGRKRAIEHYDRGEKMDQILGMLRELGE